LMLIGWNLQVELKMHLNNQTKNRDELEKHGMTPASQSIFFYGILWETK